MEKTIDGIVHAVGHPLTIPMLLVFVGSLFAIAGLDVANIAISILTLVLLPILQGSQNRDSAALQAKLDALIKNLPEVPNRYIGLDRKSEHEIESERE